ncbi:MAG TPA: MBOAT family protein, partial [Bacteroidales bacterium]|nr:MBOAT family protein [Bacteroidales bacterium]
MLFNSSVFAIFLCIVFCLYWFVFKQIKQQNILLLLASLFFYGWWDWRFLSLICFSSVLDFAIGLALQNTQIQSKRKWLLITSIVVNIGLLFTFKYYNFFVESFIYVFHTFGINLNIQTL